MLSSEDQLVLPFCNLVRPTASRVKSPLNYIGGKHRLLNQILPLFPENIGNFVDLFAGGCSVGINVRAKKIHFNDNLKYLIDMYLSFKDLGEDKVLLHTRNRIIQFGLTSENEDGYIKFRQFYNTEKNPLDLFVLVAYSFNHQIRFNSKHQFNNPFGRSRSHFNSSMEKNLVGFISKLRELDTEFHSRCFSEFDFDFLGHEDLVYCDPPYLITTGTYNDGKRGFKGWGEKEEVNLLDLLNSLHSRGIRFALSNVFQHKGNENLILQKWVTMNNYNVHYLNADYSNSNYQKSGSADEGTIEVLITNY